MSIFKKDSFRDAIVIALVAALSSVGRAPEATAQALNPPYLKDFPSVERVMREEQADEPHQTALLQLQAFWELGEIVKELSGPREFGRGANGLTPDESRLFQMYNNAFSKLSQESNEKFPGPYGNWKRFSLNVHIYPRNSGPFGVEGAKVFEKLLPAEIKTRFDSAITFEAARHQRIQQQEQAAMQAANTKPESSGGVVNWAPLTNAFMSNDPGSKFTRRCLELGGSQMECMGKGLGGSLMSLIGMNPAGMTSHPKPGLRMTGVYRSGNGSSLTFKEDSVVITGCGELVPLDLNYSISKQGSKLQIQWDSTPRALAIFWTPDGKISGPGVVTLDGQIISGYRNVHVVEYDGQGYPVPGTGHWVREPIYAPKTERCQIGIFSPVGGTATTESTINSFLGMLSGQSTEQQAQNAKKMLTAPGPRLEGQYAGPGGLSMEFHTAAVVLDCGEAHVARPYSVDFAPNQITLVVSNGGNSTAMALQADGSLSGSGNVDVSGRVIVGSNANGFVFAARNARCGLGTLSPR